MSADDITPCPVCGMADALLCICGAPGHCDPVYVLGAVLAQLEDLTPEDAMDVLNDALEHVMHGRPS